MEVVLIQESFLAVGSRQKKNKNEFMEYHGIFIPFINRIYSKSGSLIFPFFTSWGLVLYLQIFVKAKIFSDNSNLTNLSDVQRLHENGKWIKYVYDRVYTLFKKWSCCSTLL